jgi:hypothetical protein
MRGSASALSRVCVVVGLLTSLSFSSCKDSKGFAGSGSVARKNPKQPSVGGNVKTERFELTSRRGAVDIVWAIDTSGSMAEEIEHVRRNFSHFISSLDATTDVKLTLLQAPLGIDVGQDLSVPGHNHIRRRIGSTNALESIADDLVVRRSIPLRPDASLVIVVVTDDDAERVTHQNFLELVAPGLGGKVPVMYAFRGDVSRTGCYVARKGRAYEELAMRTNGKVFDICEPDWRANFSDLKKSVSDIVTSNFKLADPLAREIVAVSIDGVDVPQESFSVSGSSVTLRPESIPFGAKTVEVKYKSTTVSQQASIR